MANPIAIDLKSIRGPVAIAVAFIFSRALLYVSGVTFYSSFIHRMWQALDISQLSGQLAESLWYLHAQPPLFNALVGVLVKVFPSHYDKVFLMLNLIGSMSAALCIYLTLRKLKVSDRLATGLALLLLLNPAIMLYENLFSYTVLTIFQLSLMLYFLVVFLVDRTLWAWTSCCAMLALIVLTRSSFHLAWMVIIVTIALATSPGQMRAKLLFAALLPIMIATSWYVKNYLIFESFSSSSWLGMNMARVFPPATPLGSIRPFKQLSEYYPHYTPARRYPQIHVLADEKKSTGYVNYNHEDYLEISKLFRRDVMQTIASDFGQVPVRVSDGLIIFFAPATHGPFIDINLPRIQPYAAVASFDFSDYKKYQAIRPGRSEDTTSNFMLANGFTTTAALPVAFMYMAVLTLTGLVWMKATLSSTERCLLLILLFILAYGMLVGNLLEFGENNRFRLEVTPVFFALSGIALDRALLLFQKIKHGFKILK